MTGLIQSDRPRRMCYDRKVRHGPPEAGSRMRCTKKTAYATLNLNVLGRVLYDSGLYDTEYL